MNDELCGTAVTGKTISDLLSKSPQLELNGHQLVEVDAKIIGEGQGFTSKVLRVVLKWSEKSISLPESIIVKVIGSTALTTVFTDMTKEAVDNFYQLLYTAHNTECMIYELKGLPKIVPMPRCYAKVPSVEKSAGIMVLEDLSDRAVTESLTKWGLGLSDGQVEQILNAVASVHAWSVNDTDWQKTIPHLTEENNVLAPLLESMVNYFPQSKTAHPDLFKNVTEDTVKANINPEKYLELFGCDPKARYNLPNVLVHGDIHVMNMMFDKTAQGAGDKLVALIDWQISHQGCGVEDLARILIICLSSKKRREEGDKILRKYVEIFNSKVTDPSNHITYEETKRALDDMFAFFAVMWTCGLAMMDQFMIMMKHLSEEEKLNLKEHMIAFYYDNYNDAMEIYKW